MQAPIDSKYDRKGQKFLCGGVNLAFPDDLQPSGKFPILENVTSYQNGVVQQRPGTGSAIYPQTVPQKVHSLQRLNEYSTDAHIHLAGIDGRLFAAYDFGTITQIDTGYSGQPLSMIPFRPENAVVSWMYIADVLRMRKAGFYGGANYAIGVAPPTTAPVLTLGSVVWKTIDTEALTWASSGGAGAVTAPSRIAVATTISAIKYDSGTTGWACVRFTNANTDFSFFGEGGRYVFAAAEEAILSEAHRTVSSTIDSILYDSGTTGLCTIQPAASIPGYVRNAMVQLGGSSEYVRILSVTTGDNGTFSFRCSTANTHAAGDTITGFSSYRFYLTGTRSAGDAITCTGRQTTITLSGTSTTGGIKINLAAPIDLLTAQGRPVQDEDYMHISIKADSLANISECRVEMDIDSATTNVAAVADFTQNTFYKTFRANDFASAAQQTLTSINSRQTAIQRNLIDTSTPGQPSVAPPQIYDVPANPTPLSDQTGTGNTQWSELLFRISDLVRVGTDASVSLSSVKALRVNFTVSATTTVAFEGWWVGGTAGPDTPPPTGGYYYRYRYRASETGAHSIPGPANRSQEFVERAGIYVGSLVFSVDPQVDKIDIERFGGTNPEWHYIGTTPNSGDNFYFDGLRNSSVKTNEALDVDAYQPFPLVGPYTSGRVDVSGTSVKYVSGDSFNVNWAAGVEINIDGTLYTFYAPPSSTSRLETVENVGTKASVPWFIQEPLVMGQPLPVMFGDFHGFMFGVGDIYRPGTLIYTKGNDPDSAPENYNQEVTNPSEPLMNGAVLDSRAYVFSSDRMFGIYPAFETDKVWRVDQVANSRGLFARWALCTGGGNIYFLAKDGIYRTGGEGFESLTDADLYNLFPHDGQVGTAVNGFYPPDMTRPDDLRLNFCDNWIQFCYYDTAGVQRSLWYDVVDKSWWPQKFALSGGKSIQMFYGDQGRAATQLLAGGTNGKIYAMTIGHNDDGVEIACHVRTPATDQGDSRAEKKYGDLALDADCQGQTLTCQIGFNNFATTETAETRTNSSRAFLDPLNIQDGEGSLARNVGLDITWSGAAALYFWEPAFIIQPEFSTKRATDWANGGYEGAKFVQGVKLRANTTALAKSLLVQYDGGQSGPTVSVNHNGEETKGYPLGGSGTWTPFIAHEMRFLPQDDVAWQYFGAEWVWEPVPELATTWTTQETTHDLTGWQHIRYGFIPYISTGATRLIVTVDGVDYTYGLPDPAGAYTKALVVFQPIKGRYFKYSVQNSGGARVFIKDVEIYAKAWGSDGPYTRCNPFGDLSRANGGARI